MLDVKGWDVVTIDAAAPVLLALQEMESWNVGALVVTTRTSHRGGVGVLSERDVARALLRHGCHVLSLPVRDVMSRDTPSCQPSDRTTSCLATMIRGRHPYLPVVANGALCGLVTLADLAEQREQELEWSEMRPEQPSLPDLDRAATGNGRFR